ncbi:KPN_01571 family protein [Huaxiibacter chinensis]
MNPFYWVIITIFTVDALRELFGVSTLPQLIDVVSLSLTHYLTLR